MAINYWHRRAGDYDGVWGIYHRTPYNPEFWKAARVAFPEIRYRRDWSAFWLPEDSSYRFDHYAVRHGIGTPCSRCRRQEPCGSWPEWRPKDSWQSKFEQETADYFRQYEDFWQKQATGPTASWADWEDPLKQRTYGRRVDPDFTDQQREQFRQERQRRQQERKREQEAREPPIQQPPDVRARAADILGIGEHATVEEIKAAVRKLAFQHHPDRGGSADRMAEILGARDVMLGRTTRRYG